MRLTSLGLLVLLAACKEPPKWEAHDAAVVVGQSAPSPRNDSGGATATNSGVPTAAGGSDRGLGGSLDEVRDAGSSPPLFSEPRLASGLLADVRAAGLMLVFASERSGAPQVHRWDGEFERALTAEPAHHLQDVAVKHREALVSRVDGETEQLVAVNLDDAGVRDVGPRMEKAHGAVVSADERLVAFEASLKDAASIAVMPFDGSSEPRVVAQLGQTGSFQPALTLDGRLVFTNSSTGDPELYLQPLDGGAPTQLTAFHMEDFSAVPAPDGQRFAFVSNREGSDRIFVQRLDGRNVSRLMAGPRAQDDSERDPVWMPDSKSVLVTVRVNGVSRIARVDVGTHKTLWTSSGPGNDQLPRPSPDGRFIAFVSDRLGNPDVFIMRANGNDATRVTSDPAPEYGPRWSTLR